MTMRKLFAFSLALLFASALCGISFAADDPTFPMWKNKSDKTGDSHPVRVLKMVRNPAREQNTDTLDSGDAVVYSLVSDDGISIATTTTSADGAFAGILVTAIPTGDANSTNFRDDRGRRNWGWAIVHGPVAVDVSAGGTNGNAAGDIFITST